METRDIQTYVTFKAKSRGDFGGKEALAPNDIRELDIPQPEFVTAFKAKLTQRRRVKPGTVNLVFISSHATAVIDDCHSPLRN